MQTFHIHPENPQFRAIQKAAVCLRDGGIVGLPTDTVPVFSTTIGDFAAIKRIIQIHGVKRSVLPPQDQVVLLCRDLSQASEYVHLDNAYFRQLKAAMHEPFTFVFRATRSVPKSLIHDKKKTIAVRFANTPVLRSLLDELQDPLVLVPILLSEPLAEILDNQSQDPWLDDILDDFERLVDLALSYIPVSWQFGSVVNLTEDTPIIEYQNKGDAQKYFG